MAIHPIDLSSIYAQMDNVAKYNASADKMAALTGQVNQNKLAQENLQLSKGIQKVSKEEQTAVKVNEDGNGKQDQQAGENKKKEKHEEDSETGQWEITDPSLGQHIDITT